MKGRSRREEIGGSWKLAFWNVTKLGDKNKDFWECLRKWGIMVLSDTWVDEKGGRYVPRRYVWEVQFAKRRKRRRRAINGMVFGMRKGFNREGDGIRCRKGGDNYGKGEVRMRDLEDYRNLCKEAEFRKDNTRDRVDYRRKQD